MTDLPADAVPPEALRVVATIPTDPARAADAGAALAALAAASREEEGCFAYDVYESTSAPGTFVTVEAWRSQADMDAHMATPHLAEAFTVLGPLVAGDIALHPLRAV
ncbi:putative quinol monooxygenase [Nocardioides sp.]|uniref:putative quinol monooxygenase n=1 Tax=Nocardioides sp. TaxID=35761 RepID=UPI00378372F7